MDIRMPVIDGIEATRQITGRRAAAAVLILTTFDLDEYVFGALRAGASGFLLKDVRPGELVAAIRTVAPGDAVVLAPGHPAADRGVRPGPAAVPATAGAALPAAGHADRARARGAVASPTACPTPRSPRGCSSPRPPSSPTSGRILAKLGLRDRVQAVVLAYESGLVQPGVR